MLEHSNWVVQMQDHCALGLIPPSGRRGAGVAGMERVSAGPQRQQRLAEHVDEAKGGPGQQQWGRARAACMQAPERQWPSGCHCQAGQKDPATGSKPDINDKGRVRHGCKDPWPQEVESWKRRVAVLPACTVALVCWGALPRALPGARASSISAITAHGTATQRAQLYIGNIEGIGSSSGSAGNTR
jgi:hypothetical protein